MKFFIMIFFLLANKLFFCQGDEQYLDNEFTIQIENALQKTIVFEMIPIGANWAKTLNGSLYLYNDNTTYISTLSGQSIGYIICAHNGFEYRFYNEGNYTLFNECASSTAGLKPLRNASTE